MIAASIYWRRIGWQAVVCDARRTVTVTTIVLLLLATVGGLAGALMADNYLIGACDGSGVMLAILGWIYWMRFATGAATQNSPANAQLVPDLTSQVRSTVVMGWLLTLAMMLPFCYSSRIGALSLVLISIAATGAGMYRAGREDGLVVAVLAMLVYVFAMNWPALVPALTSAPVLAIGTFASLVYGWFGLRAAFPRGGDAHWALQGKQRKASALDKPSSWDEVLTKDGRRNRVYSFLLKRYGGSESGKRKMLMMGLGPGMHSFHYGYVVLIAVVLGLLAKPVAIWLSLPVDNLAHNMGPHVLGSVIGIVCFAGTRFAITIRATSGEQALLMLTPGMPRKPALTRELGRRILGSCLSEWSVAALTAFALVVVWGGDRIAYQVTAILMACCLLAAGFSLDDYSRKAKPSIVGMVLLSLWVFGLLVASLAMGESALAWSILFALMLLTAALYVQERWRNMMQSPVAFPAMRLV